MDDSNGQERDYAVDYTARLPLRQMSIRRWALNAARKLKNLNFSVNMSTVTAWVEALL
jgi:hypothetical protein